MSELKQGQELPMHHGLKFLLREITAMNPSGKSHYEQVSNGVQGMIDEIEVLRIENKDLRQRLQQSESELARVRELFREYQTISEDTDFADPRELQQQLKQAEDAAATFANDVSRLAEQLDHFRNLHAASQQRIEQLEKSNGELCKAKGGLWKENENLKFWEIPTLRRLVESSQQRMAELEKDKERLDAAEKYAGNIDIYLKPMPRILTSQPWICCGESLRSALDKLKRDFDSATTQQEGEKL